MKAKKLATLFAAIVAILSICAAGPFRTAMGGDYPAKGITILCPTAAGGGLDIVIRCLAAEMEKDLGRKITIVNKSGGAAIGVTEFHETAKPDGYNFMIIDKGLISNYMTGVFPYGWRDFEPVGSVENSIQFIVCGADKPFKTIQDFIAATKAAPDTLSIGTSGSSGISFLSVYGFVSQADIPAKIVPFSGGAELKSNVAGGHVDCASLQTGEVLSLVEAGMLRVLACVDSKRSETFPDVPTLIDIGVDFSITQAKALWAPKGTPKEYIDIFAAALEKAVRSDAYTALCKTNQTQGVFLNPQELAADYEVQEKLIGEMIENAGLAK